MNAERIVKKDIGKMVGGEKEIVKLSSKLAEVKKEEIHTISRLQKDITDEIVSVIKTIHGQKYSTYMPNLKKLKDNFVKIQKNIRNEKLSFDAKRAAKEIDNFIGVFEDAKNQGLFTNDKEKLQQFISTLKKIDSVIVEDLDRLKRTLL